MKDVLVVMAYTRRDIQCGECGCILQSIGHYVPAKTTPPTPSEPFRKYVRCDNKACGQFDVIYEVDPDVKLKRYEAK